MVENGSQGRKIRGLQADVESLQQDVCEAYESLNNIRNSAPEVKVFSDDDFETVEVLDLDFDTGEVNGVKRVTPEEVQDTDD
jgi:hypothetical protein